MAVTPTTFINRARSDKLVINLYQNYIILARRLPLNDYMARIKQMHMNIPSTKLIHNNSLTASAQKIAETAALIQSMRSNIVHMKMTLFIEEAKLAEYVDSIRNHLTYTYYGAIISDYRISDMRKNSIDFVLQAPVTLLKRIKTLISYADLAIGDLDKAGFTITNITKALEQVSKDRSI
jgi:hypothetical protein